MDIIRRYWYIFLVLIFEGLALMTVELPGAKSLTPFYGSSLYVWTAVLTIAILSLTLGYHSGEIIYAKHSTEKRLILIFGIAAIFVFALPSTASLLTSISREMGFSSAISVAGFPLFVLPMFCFGLIEIRAVRLFEEKNMMAAVPGLFRKTKSLFST